ncbi:hypothetical protein DHD05_11660 [Arenibacter sp. N53]|nr:hypothetical protein [Arenibacter sp. N53]
MKSYIDLTKKQDQFTCDQKGEGKNVLPLSYTGTLQFNKNNNWSFLTSCIGLGEYYGQCWTRN